MKKNKSPVIRLKDYTPPSYRIDTVHLIFSLHPQQTRVRSKLAVRRNKGTSAGEPLVLDGDELTLVSVLVDGKPVAAGDLLASPSRLVIRKPPSKAFTLEIETEIAPETNTRLMGLYRSSGNYCTQCEAEGFRRITYFLDRPDVMAVYSVRIEADAKDNPVLLSNGNPGKKGKLANGRHFAEWHDPHPKPSYLFALVAGDLEVLKDRFVTASGAPVDLGIYVEKGKHNRAAYAMDALKRSMKWDEDAFGREYDLDVFNIVAVSDFNMGAMENKGLNVFNDKFVLADPESATDADYAGIERVIAHEYFHNWTGNRITCRDWFQLCLKEGLTVYRDQRFGEDMRSVAVQRIGQVRTLRANQFAEDSGPLAHPVRPEKYKEINNFYTATVYEKGAELVRMIATIVGEKAFRKGMDLYFRRHDGDAATIEDFIACFEQAGKRDLSQFALWYSQAGTPVLPVSARYDASASELTLEIEQSLPATPGQTRKKPMHIPLRFGLLDSAGRPMSPETITGVDCSADILHLTGRNHRIVFGGLSARPAVSLNGGFSAPVIIEFTQSKTDLLTLARHDPDLVNRWQAIQELSMRQLLAAARALNSAKAPKWDAKFFDAIAELAADASLEPAYRALILTPPGESEIAQAWARNVNPDAIHRARTAFMAELGTRLSSAIEPLSRDMNEGIFSPDAASAGKRALVNAVLALGVAANDASAEAASLSQFETAGNMNDRFAAFQRIVHMHGSRSQAAGAIKAFEDRYGGDPLAMDKWFMVQATAPGAKAAENIRALTSHSAFTWRNPNRVRSLIGAFAMANASGFNDAGGEGYRFVAESIARLDGINPQVAARIATGFRSYKILEPGRRKLAHSALTGLQAGGNLSRDTTELVEKMLE